MRSQVLIVVNGHSGAGKSTLARALANLYVAQGATSVAVDLDHIVRMESSHDGRPSAHEIWMRARRAAAGLAEAFFAHGIEVVVIEGDFFARYTPPAEPEGSEPTAYDARADFLAHLTDERPIAVVTLRVSFDEALRRVQADSERRPDAVSRRPDFVRRNHDWFESLVPALPSTDIVIDTDGRSVDDMVTEVVARIDQRRALTATTIHVTDRYVEDLRALLVESEERRLRARFQLDDVPLGLVTSGYEKLVVLAPDRVFTFPRNHLHVHTLEREAAVLAALDLEFAPTLLGRHEDRRISPYPFLELTRLPGTSWDLIDGSLGDDQAAGAMEHMATRIAQIHDITIPGELGDRPRHLDTLRVTDAWTDPAVLVVTIRRLIDSIGLGADAPVDAWMRQLEPVTQMSPVTLHGEMSDGQFLVDADLRVVGVVDWAGAHVGNPLRDLDFGTAGHRVSYRPKSWPDIRERMWTAYTAERHERLPDWSAVDLFWRLLDIESHRRNGEHAMARELLRELLVRS